MNDSSQQQLTVIAMEAIAPEILPATADQNLAAEIFRNAEARMMRTHQTIAQHIDRRIDTRFSEALARPGLSEGDRAEISGLQQELKADFAARQQGLNQRLTSAFQHLALADIAAVSAAIGLGADAASGEAIHGEARTVGN